MMRAPTTIRKIMMKELQRKKYWYLVLRVWRYISLILLGAGPVGGGQVVRSAFKIIIDIIILVYKLIVFYDWAEQNRILLSFRIIFHFL